MRLQRECEVKAQVNDEDATDVNSFLCRVHNGVVEEIVQPNTLISAVLARPMLAVEDMILRVHSIYRLLRRVMVSLIGAYPRSCIVLATSGKLT